MKCCLLMYIQGKLGHYMIIRYLDDQTFIPESEKGLSNFFNNSHLVGDLAYKLDSNLMVGFKDHGHLTVRQKNFNVILNKVRVKIENAFALLKGRFRRLKLLETVRLDLTVLLIMSTCILHNIPMLIE